MIKVKMRTFFSLQKKKIRTFLLNNFFIHKNDVVKYDCSKTFEETTFPSWNSCLKRNFYRKHKTSLFKKALANIYFLKNIINIYFFIFMP